MSLPGISSGIAAQALSAREVSLKRSPQSAADGGGNVQRTLTPTDDGGQTLTSTRTNASGGTATRTVTAAADGSVTVDFNRTLANGTTVSREYQVAPDGSYTGQFSLTKANGATLSGSSSGQFSDGTLTYTRTSTATGAAAGVSDSRTVSNSLSQGSVARSVNGELSNADGATLTRQSQLSSGGDDGTSATLQLLLRTAVDGSSTPPVVTPPDAPVSDASAADGVPLLGTPPESSAV